MHTVDIAMLPSLLSFRSASRKAPVESARAVSSARPNPSSILPKCTLSSKASLVSLHKKYTTQPSLLYRPGTTSTSRVSSAFLTNNTRARFFTSRPVPTPESLQRSAQTTAERLVEVWTEWSATEDVFLKRQRGKYAIELYTQFSKHITALAKDQADFEHLALVHGHPLAVNAYRMGLLHAQRSEYEPAVENLQRAVELDPMNYEYYMTFGEVLHVARMYGTAVQAYTTILNTMNSEFKKSLEQPKLVPLPESLQSPLFKSLNLAPRTQYPHSKLAEALFRRGHAHLMLHNFEDALGDWKSVVGLEPNHRTAESWAYLSHLSRIHGKWQQTIDLSTKALQFDPQLLLAFYERSMAHFVMKNEEAMKFDNRTYAVLSHERMWGLSSHPIPEDWGQDGEEDDAYEDQL